MGWYDGLEGEFSKRIQAMIEASGGRLGVGSGYRSVETQQQLWDQAVAQYGPEEARNWVAPPGKSNHNAGMAVDLAFLTGDATEWAHANAARFGLAFPMEWEPWHIEPAGLRDGSYAAMGTTDPAGGGVTPGTSDAYTTPPDGYLAADDPARRADLGYQLQALNSLMLRSFGGENPSAVLGGVGNPQGGALTPTGAATPDQAAQPTGVN